MNFQVASSLCSFATCPLATFNLRPDFHYSWPPPYAPPPVPEGSTQALFGSTRGVFMSISFG